jgi:hypothetical protein
VYQLELSVLLICCPVPSLTSPCAEARPGAFCGGSVDFVLGQSLVAQVTFIFGGLFYYAVLMKRKPFTYFSVAYPLIVLAIMGTAVPMLLWTLPALLASLLVSVGTVLPYYLNSYTTYVVAASVPGRYYGFAQGLIGFGSNVVAFAPYGMVALQTSVGTTIGVALALMGLSAVVSVTFAVTHRDALMHITVEEDLPDKPPNKPAIKRAASARSSATGATGAGDPHSSSEDTTLPPRMRALPV